MFRDNTYTLCICLADNNVHGKISLLVDPMDSSDTVSVGSMEFTKAQTIYLWIVGHCSHFTE